METSISSIDTTITTALIIWNRTGEYFVPPTCPIATNIGANCNVSVNPCDLLDPCQNDGTCIRDNNTLFGYICLCHTNIGGPECQYDYRLCQSDTCWHNGRVFT